MLSGEITFDRKSLIIDGERVVLVGGEYHYFRTPREHWEEKLRQMKQAGCNMVTTYIPWNFHEPVEGEFDWEGDRDVRYFLDLCKKYDQYVVIKPGPYICAEWDFGGFPDWILEKNVTLRYPGEAFLALTHRWYTDVAEIIRPYQVTKGGPIVLIQIENEYDHVIRYSAIDVTEEEAKEYLLTLLRYVREAGLTIPAFTNEGEFVHKTDEIINARTYYPNIPFLWLWEFEPYDGSVEFTAGDQGEKPLMILEIEAGWFADNNLKDFNVDSTVMEAILKSVYTYGTSVFNLYMMVGGTTFGGWLCRGDFDGIGLCNSYDFGGAPIREWGQIHEKFHFLRLFSYFLQDFPELLLDGQVDKEGARFIAGGETITRLYPDHVENPAHFDLACAKTKVLLRRSPVGGTLSTRNLDEAARLVRFSFRSNALDRDVEFPQQTLNAPSHSAFLFPVDLDLGDDLRLVYATSELVARRTLGETTWLIMKGHEETAGEIALKGNVNVQVLSGDVTIESTDEMTTLHLNHRKLSVVEIGDLRLMILPNQEAKKLWLDDDLILLSDTYYYAGSKCDANGAQTLAFKEMASATPSETLLWTDRPLSGATADGAVLPFERDEALGAYRLTRRFEEHIDAAVPQWQGDWRFMPDTSEISNELDFSGWPVIDGATSLENAGYLSHHYFWYKQAFEIPEGATNVTIDLKTNDIDRMTVYVNETPVWVGIKSTTITVDKFVNPGRNIISISYENAFHTKCHPNEGPIQKHSGLFNPVKLLWKQADTDHQFLIEQWHLQDGLGGMQKGYSEPTFDDSNWAAMPGVKSFVNVPETGNLLWLRRSFSWEKTEGWEAPVCLSISKIDARCYIYVNGFYLARYEDKGPQRKVYIPESLLREENSVALMIEGPGVHFAVPYRFEPIRFEEPTLEFYFTAKESEWTLNP